MNLIPGWYLINKNMGYYWKINWGFMGVDFLEVGVGVGIGIEVAVEVG